MSFEVARIRVFNEYEVRPRKRKIMVGKEGNKDWGKVIVSYRNEINFYN
jgi:hypothetical protein